MSCRFLSGFPSDSFSSSSPNYSDTNAPFIVFVPAVGGYLPVKPMAPGMVLPHIHYPDPFLRPAHHLHPPNVHQLHHLHQLHQVKYSQPYPAHLGSTYAPSLMRGYSLGPSLYPSPRESTTPSKHKRRRKQESSSSTSTSSESPSQS